MHEPADRFEISVAGQFAATHQLRYPDGVLEPAHEHRWHVTVTYGGTALNDVGIVADFDAVRSQLAELLRSLEGQHLNNLPELARPNPSAECVALLVARRLPSTLPGAAYLRCVAVEEAPGCVARYFPAPPE
jgi:6-pyruvoyl-tetrahydropterin synthase